MAWFQLTGCESAPDSSRIGVFASTTHGLLELTTYGKEIGEAVYELPNAQTFPSSTSVRSFYINMPDSTITESKLYWMSSIGKTFNESGQSPLSITLVAKREKLYQVACADLAQKKDGYAILKVSMPLGQPDRIYVVHVTP
jgi:hypothetical protein